MRWGELEAAAPAVAARGRERLDRFGFALLGTIRRDGTPRISPVEVHFVRGELVVVLMARTHKLRDVLRDPRVVLNAVVTDAQDPGGELKLRGRLVPVSDPELCAAAADVVEAESGWRPPADWRIFALDVDDAAYVAWDAGHMRMDRWSAVGGLEHAEHRIVL